MIPPFNEDGNLPPGAHESSPAEAERALVDVFGESLTRRRLYEGWRERRRLIAALVPIGKEWVYGSFVTLKRDPSDIDVVIFLDGEAMRALSPNDRKQLWSLIGDEDARRRFGCHSFVVPTWPTGHAGHTRQEHLSALWHAQWSVDQRGLTKGYLDVRGDP